MGICTILKDEVGDIILSHHLSGLDRSPDYHLALAAIAQSLGQREVVAQISRHLRKEEALNETQRHNWGRDVS